MPTAIGVVRPLILWPAGSLAGLFPVMCLASALAIPLLVLSAQRARGTYTTPRAFVPAIRAIVACYAAGVLLFTLGIVAAGIAR